MMQFSHSPLEDWARATLLPLKWLLPSKQNAPNSNMQMEMSTIIVGTKKSVRLHGLFKVQWCVRNT